MENKKGLNDVSNRLSLLKLLFLNFARRLSPGRRSDYNSRIQMLRKLVVLL